MSDIVFLSLYQCPQLVKGNKTMNADLKALYTHSQSIHTHLNVVACLNLLDKTLDLCSGIYIFKKTAMNFSPTSVLPRQDGHLTIFINLISL